MSLLRSYKGLKLCEKGHITEEKFLVYYVPIRDWNKRLHKIHLVVDDVYYVPIRDWNGNRGMWRCLPMGVYYVPIRDWNKEKEDVVREYVKSLLRSYKGLKHFRYFHFRDFRFLVYYVPIRDWNPTLPNFFKTGGNIVYYVPIRDWNICTW